MTLEASELSKRVATGVVGGALLMALVVLGGWVGIFFITTAISLGMINEFSKITLSLPDRDEKRYILLCVTWFVVLTNMIAPRAEYEFLLVSFLGLFIYFLFTAGKYAEDEFTTHFKELMYSLFGLFYLTFIPLYLPRMHESANGVNWTVLFFLIIWAGDTGAYFIGKRYGRRRLYYKISPKKTLEGSLGGLLVGIAVTVIYKLALFGAMPWISVPFIPIVVGVLAQIGDLCESFFKRAFDKKDSGTFLPGHGGFMDRFDSVIFGLPAMYACIRVFT